MIITLLLAVVTGYYWDKLPKLRWVTVTASAIWILRPLWMDDRFRFFPFS